MVGRWFSRKDLPSMKTKILLSAVLGCSLVVMNLKTAAQSTNGSGPGLSEKFNATFFLTSTADAPAGSSGRATINAQTDETGTTGKALVQTTGLDPGEYTVSIVKASDGSTADLGTFTINDPSNGNTNSHRKLRNSTSIDLPTDIDPSDVAQLEVSTGGTVMLIGDLTNPADKSKATFNATVPLTPGEAAPDASGTARLRSFYRKGVLKNRFTLLANGVPPSSTFSVDVDGQDGGSVTSNSKGRVMVKSLPAGLTNLITTVRLLDTNAAEVVEADF